MFAFWLVIAAVILVLLCACVIMNTHARIYKRERYLKTAKNCEQKFPDRENRYLQSRLSTDLRGAERRKIPINASLSYVKKMLRQLTEKSLSGADGLWVRKLRKELMAIPEKNLAKPSDIEGIPNLLTSVLALCAKYGVSE